MNIIHQEKERKCIMGYSLLLLLIFPVVLSTWLYLSETSEGLSLPKKWGIKKRWGIGSLFTVGYIIGLLSLLYVAYLMANAGFEFSYFSGVYILDPK